MFMPERVSSVPFRQGAANATRKCPVVNFEKNPTLSYSTEVTLLTEVRHLATLMEPFPRGTMPLRLPMSRIQRMPWLIQQFALDAFCRKKEISLRFFKFNQHILLRQGSFNINLATYLHNCNM